MTLPGKEVRETRGSYSSNSDFVNIGRTGVVLTSRWRSAVKPAIRTREC